MTFCLVIIRVLHRFSTAGQCLSAEIFPSINRRSSFPFLIRNTHYVHTTDINIYNYDSVYIKHQDANLCTQKMAVLHYQKNIWRVYSEEIWYRGGWLQVKHGKSLRLPSEAWVYILVAFEPEELWINHADRD